MLKVLIADDQKLLRESFKSIIENNSDIKVVGCVKNGQEAYDFCKGFMPDVILMDISMPVCKGTEATKRIKSKYPEIKILILTSSSDKWDIAEAIESGADGYIVKDIGMEELILSIRISAAGLGIVHRDVLNCACFNNKEESVQENRKSKTVKVEGIDIPLTEKELSIIEKIVAGKDNKEIGTMLFLAEGTVKNKITEITSKLHLKDRTQLAVFAIKNNLV
ncbi:response regulator transcription factor [Geosporobacter ferrireducens]|uniref:Stage 0 sporulation protein A homolog n=1 Tax=Geosporobacter ferrireducens TaxID=1424294 RepID=A0A1D8GEI1_9FIRM|nr:response regulator transcription factor [Geosporobacter ferrireducens]AOT69307.1 DNA-binding response regulator [Geosporobacter ferrireducens]